MQNFRIMQKLTMIFLVAEVCCLAYVAAADVDCDILPEYVSSKSCCPMPDLISNDIKDKCKGLNKYDDKSDESNKSDERRPHHPCFMRCVFNETGILNTNIELNEANLKAYLPIVLKNAKEMIPVVEESFKTCVSRIHAMMEAHMRNNPSTLPPPKAGDRMMRPRCNNVGIMIMDCVMMENVDHCVASIWNNTPQCNNWRNFMRACVPHRQQGKQ